MPSAETTTIRRSNANDPARTLCVTLARARARAGLWAVLALLLAPPELSLATTWVVNPPASPPGDFLTIQDAINSSQVGGGDVIELGNGTFWGPGDRDIDFLGKSLTVRSHGGDPAQCIIDCGGSQPEPHRGFMIHSGESAVIEGITITNGYETADDGGAICARFSVPTIRNCRLTLNTAEGNGGAISCYQGSSLIVDCAIEENHAGGNGGGVSIGGGYATLQHCTISRNTATLDGAGAYGESTSIQDCILSSNTANQDGGGLRISNCSVLRSTVSDNTSHDEGGGVYGVSSVVAGTRISGNWGHYASGGIALYGGSMTDCTVTGNFCELYGPGGIRGDGLSLTRCTVAGNMGYDVGAWMDSGTATALQCIFYGNCTTLTGGTMQILEDGIGSIWLTCCCFPDNVGNVERIGPQVEADPLFCGLEPCGNAPTSAGDYTLRSGSPCLRQNSPCDALIGSQEEGCNGPTAVENATWGQIKYRFR